MALMFTRLAHNYIKNGYFPTDDDTLSGVLHALQPVEQGAISVLDPTAGEGVALAEIKHALGSNRTTAYGIEYEAERAQHAKTLLDRCLHSDYNDCVLASRAWSLLFLNPPYGALVTDKAQTGSEGGSHRMEEQFLRQATHHLQYGGVLVYIIPRYSLNTRIAKLLVHYYDGLQVFLAPEQRFKQIVVFGYRKRADSTGQGDLLKHLVAQGQGEIPIPQLPDETWPSPYRVPAATEQHPTFFKVQLDPLQLADEIDRFGHGLWGQFDHQFGQRVLPERRPLRPLSSWHLALALAAGQISGEIRSAERTLLVKGGTRKEKQVSMEMIVDEDGRKQERRIAQDIFVPVIRAIELTPGENFGQVITIK